MADKLFIDFPEKIIFADDDVSIIADSEDSYKVKKIKKSTMKWDTWATPVSVDFVWDDMVFVKDDSNTVTLEDAKITLKGETWNDWVDWAVIFETIWIPSNSIWVDWDRAFDTSVNAYVYIKIAWTWALKNSLRWDTWATGATGATITSGTFVGNDLVFTKSDASTVTIVWAKTDLKWDKWDKTIIYSTVGIPSNAIWTAWDWAFDTSSNGNVYYKASTTWALVNSYRWPQWDTWATGATGATGAKWDKWDTGLQGIQWIQGIQWPAGTNWTDWDGWLSLVPKWPYSAWAAYILNDVVSYLGSSWIALQNTTGNTPSEWVYWTLNASKGTDGTGSGDISGSGTANEIAYFTAEKTIDNLPVATYPSLAELAYVKGTTSSIQTQLGNKQPLATVLTNTTASFTTAQETKLSGIAAGAEVNVNADWNAVSWDAQILNKPTISGSNTWDQTSIVWITWTKAQFDTAVTDWNILYVGDVTSNATHTGDVTGATALTIDKTAITGKTAVTAETWVDYMLISDTSDGWNLKKALVATGGWTGTVTSVSVATANWVSWTVSNPTTTPAISLTLWDITPTSVNWLKVNKWNNSIAWNTAIWESALVWNNSWVWKNVAVWFETLKVNTSGEGNVAIWYQSLVWNTIWYGNNAIWFKSLTANTSGNNNNALGFYSLLSNSTGSYNIGLWYSAGKYETGSNAFYVDSRDRTNTAWDKAWAILYWVMSDTPSSQTLAVNAALTSTYGINIPTGQTYKINWVDQFALKQDVITWLTASWAELNILDWATLTTTELNYVDWVTSSIQTQLNWKQASGSYEVTTNKETTALDTSTTKYPCNNVVKAAVDGKSPIDSPVFTTKIQTPTIELGHATDTTLSRVSAGEIAVEWIPIIKAGSTTVWQVPTITGANTYTWQTPSGWSSWGSYMFAIAWTIGVTGTNVANTVLCNWTKTITSVDLWYGTAWSGTLTVDVNKNWTTIFATTKPSITTTNQGSVASGTLTTTSLASGDYITIDIDAVPWTTLPVDLYVRVNYS